jgi:hypothetical protein
LFCDDHVWPPLVVTFAPPSLTWMKTSGLSGLIHMPWLSPCGVCSVRKLLPPSLDLKKRSLLMKTVSASFGCAVRCV